MLVVGEVRTCLLHNSGPLPQSLVAQVLELIPGQYVRSAERPIARAISPELARGVDCPLAASRSRARGIGTVASHAVVTDGVVLQGSSTARLHRAVVNHRLDWAHYTRQPSVIEVIGPRDVVDLADDYLADASPRATLDLGSMSEHVISLVQGRPELDHTTSIRLRATRVRWAARVGDAGDPACRVQLEGDVLRTLALTVRDNQVGLVERFCEDFALHDWLLTTIGQIIAQADRARAGGRDPMDVLRPAVERLLHLWMPGAHVHPDLHPLWDALQSRPGFSRQWNAQVARIRDQIALETLRALTETRRASTEW
ncbi:MAG: SCO2521 family protein [Pseudonocardiaceae bacterium]